MTPSLSRVAVLLAALLLVIPAGAQPPLPPPDKPETLPEPRAKEDQPEPGVKVAEKGPIHEAFAQPGADVRGKDITAPKAPPPPIPELPPESKPDGANVKWVPGYWQWDAEKNDFLWVSGFYRNVPPGREWSAGKWAEQDGKWTYTPGFWRPTNMNSWRSDLPAPPKSVESGPSTRTDNPDAIWVPGGWEFRNGQFAWRAGYWAYPNKNMMWQPGQYLANGSGYSYNPGYWDYPLEDRGLLYAPVQFTDPLWETPGWCFRPRYALGLGFAGSGGLYDSLFMDPLYNNYYYGNFYNPWAFGGGGFWGPWGWGLGFGFGWGFGFGFGFGNAFCGWHGCHPWWFAGRGFCNPLWNHCCWLNRGNPNFVAGVHAAHFANTVAARGGTTLVTNNVIRNSVITNSNVTQRSLAASPPGVGGAVQTAARSAAVTAARSTPLVQPANQVLAAQAARANATAAGLGPKAGIGGVSPGARGVGDPFVGRAGSAAGAAMVGNSVQPGNPLHAGASAAAFHNAGGIDVRPGGFNQVGNGFGQQLNPGGATMPAIRSGLGQGGTSLNPGITSGVPQIRYSSPAMPSYHAPSFTPSYHAPAFNPGSFGGGARIPSGFGGVGGVGRMGGGGGGGMHMGGGGGHGGGHR